MSSCGLGTMAGMSSSTFTRLTRLTLVALASANLLVTAHAQNTTPATPPAIRTLGTPDFAQIVQRARG